MATPERALRAMWHWSYQLLSVLIQDSNACGAAAGMRFCHSHARSYIGLVRHGSSKLHRLEKNCGASLVLLVQKRPSRWCKRDVVNDSSEVGFRIPMKYLSRIRPGQICGKSCHGWHWLPLPVKTIRTPGATATSTMRLTCDTLASTGKIICFFVQDHDCRQERQSDSHEAC